MDHKPRISVIMGIYNCADTLVEALESLESQTYKRFKVVMCDDGSTDNTLEVAKRWAETHPNYLVIQNEHNMKLAATLNHCLEYADTEYVARMDGDDISLPTRFEKEIDFLDKHQEYALVSCPMIHFDEDGDFRIGKAKPEPTKKDFTLNTPFCHAPVLMRRDALESIGRYTTGSQTERIEDYYLWHKFYCNGYKGYNLQEPLYKMRNGREAFARRKVCDRWRGYKITTVVCRNLGFSCPWIYGIPALMKVFLPIFVVRFIKTKLCKSNLYEFT